MFLIIYINIINIIYSDIYIYIRKERMRIIFEAIAWLSFLNDTLIIKIKLQVEKWDRDWSSEN